jgi:asparagine synthase (glutamine-hydrolysing)
MSSLAAIYNFNCKPLRDTQREQLETLWNRLEKRGPDGGDIILDGPVGMCYRAFHANQESRTEKQPFIRHNNLLMSGSLRLDNRDELIASLRSLLTVKEKTSDVELGLAAYEKWGDMFPRHLIGEFALTVYDPASQKCLLTRDHIGTRPLYYHYNNERLICCSDLGALLEVSGIPLEPNDEFVAGYLMYDPEPELTAYRNIYSVKPFHVVTFHVDGRRRESRYWDLGAIKPIRYKTDAEYEEGFRFHFTNAVRGPLRTDRPVFSDLSGGLDSSSIVCMAHKLIENSDVPAPELITSSLISSGSPTSDQTSYIRCVQEHVGREGHLIDEYDHPLFSTMSVENAFVNLNPLLFCEAKHRYVASLMRESNARVLLSGVGGDEITCGQQNPTPELADLLVALRFKSLHDRIQAWSKRTRRPYLSLLSNTLISLLPRPLQARYQKPGMTPNFLRSRFVKDFSLRSLGMPAAPFACDRPSGKDQAAGFYTAMRGIATGYRSELTPGYISYPFLARPFVEYMQAIPHTQRVQLGKRRFLMRRALKNVLPEMILKRKDKGDPQETVNRAFMREWSRLRPFFKDSRIASHGYVDNALFLSAVEDYRLGKGIHLVMVLKLLSLEFWLRRLEGMEPAFPHMQERVTCFSYREPAISLGASSLRT